MGDTATGTWTSRELGRFIADDTRCALREAVIAALEHSRPFADHWTYFLSSNQRSYFPSQRQFEQECGEIYRRVLEAS